MLSLKDRCMPSRTFLKIYKRGIPTMYCFVIFQKGLRSVFDESSQMAWFFCTTSTFIVIFQPIHTQNLDKLYTRTFRMNHSIYCWKLHQNPCSSFWVHREQIDRRGVGFCFIICIDFCSVIKHLLYSLLLEVKFL